MIEVSRIIDYVECVANSYLSGISSHNIKNKIDCIRKKQRDEKLYLAVVGEFNSGKSTFINALLGTRILKDLLWEKGLDVEKQHVDCGELIYNLCESEYQGGSGAGCIALVFSSYIYRRLIEKKFNRIILIATGALLSSTSSQQGESIPGIAHAVVLES